MRAWLTGIRRSSVTHTYRPTWPFTAPAGSARTPRYAPGGVALMGGYTSKSASAGPDTLALACGAVRMRERLQSASLHHVHAIMASG
jgi:hypothetical protein